MKKNAIIMGTLILTITGLITRFIGFFYRIFLSHAIGAEGMGIYQLIFPVYGICMAICCGPVQTSISRYVAACQSRRDYRQSHYYLSAGLIFSVSLSIICGLFMFEAAPAVAELFLLEKRCEMPLRVLALSMPMNALHSCICGYYLGQKKTGVSAASQLIEQLVRVAVVWAIVWQQAKRGEAVTVTMAVCGLVAGEAASMLVTCIAGWRTLCRERKMEEEEDLSKESSLLTLPKAMKNLISMSIPLTGNRLFLNILQSLEAVMIPSRLRLFGLTAENALSVYGIFNGMALPFILFPSALTGSISVMLLPDVAASQSQENYQKISRTAALAVGFSLYVSILFTGIFFFYGEELGNMVFGEPTAGAYIVILSWLCPFLYLTSMMGSILNGLGLTKITFIHNTAGLLIRLLFVIFLIPRFGFVSYLWGTLLSQLVTALLHLYELRKRVKFPFDAFYELVRPILAFGGAHVLAVWTRGKFFTQAPALFGLITAIGVSGVLYLLFLWLTRSGDARKMKRKKAAG